MLALGAIFAPLLSFFASGFIKNLLDLVTKIVGYIIDFVVWYCKQFISGIGAIFNNLSVLSVLIAVFIGGGWYFKSWDNDRVLQKCMQTCKTPVNPQKYYHPVKKVVYKYVAPQKLVYKKVDKPQVQERNPFNGN